jgi:hypothetical protein
MLGLLAVKDRMYRWRLLAVVEAWGCVCGLWARRQVELWRCTEAWWVVVVVVVVVGGGGGGGGWWGEDLNSCYDVPLI